MKWFSVMLVLLAALCAAQAEGPDDQYLRVYNLIQEADTLNNAQPDQALQKYLEAQSALRNLQKIYPDWNTKLVGFRLSYLGSKIESASPSVPNAPAPGLGSAPKPAAPLGGVARDEKSLNATFALPPKPMPAPPNELENQLNGLKDQVRQLQADKILLNAKLKESFDAQPSAIDPLELAKAEEKIKALQKESALLKVSLANEKSRPAPAPDTKAIEQAQQALAEANRKLAAQTEAANTLAREKKALQTKLDALIPRTWNAAALETTKKALEETNRQLAQQKELAAKLAAERDALQARLKGSNTEADALAALRTENQVLKKQLSDLRTAPPPAAKSDASAQKLTQAQAQIAALQSEKELLRLEKIALENRVKQMNTSVAANASAARPLPPPAVPSAIPAAGPAKPEDAARIKQLELERDDLVNKLALANKQLSGRDNPSVTARVQELQSQLAGLRARLEIFEARQVPYTPEELALFNKPGTRIAALSASAGKKSVNELPPGTAKLVAEAERYFSARQLDKAEQKYLEVLAQDENNAPALANIAAIQLELHHLDQAEKHIAKATALAPDDAYALSIFGYLKFLQEKYDDALSALSRAALLDPQNPQVQNYLGITLSQKGLRIPAENALRKAVQLDPNYGSAHHNLAVIYLTQRPPATEMARLHYQKALAVGHPHNPALEKMLEAPKTASSGQ